MALKIFIIILISLMIESSQANLNQWSQGHVDNVLVSPELGIITGQTFHFDPPLEDKINNAIELWATYYYIPVYLDGSGDFALRDLDGNELGPHLSLKNWCNSAMEGSVKIYFSNGQSKVYNYLGNSAAFSVDCQKIFPNDVSKTKFRQSQSLFGEGLALYDLAPYRTIATDPNLIPPGTVIYIPEARGAKIKLNNGQVIVHDGYFFAGDRGGAIKQNHIDVFIGIDKSADYFSWISNTSEKTFHGYIVTDQQIIDELTNLHLKKHKIDL